MIPVIAIPSIIYFCADKYTSTTGNITILHAAISTGQSVKYNPLNVFSIKGRVNFSCEFKNNIGTKAKKKDRVCGECGREYKIGEMVGMMTIHGKSSIHLCTSCGNKYIELGAIDINENRRIRSELESKIYDLNKYEKLEGVETCNLQPIIDRLEKERYDWLINAMRIEYPKGHIWIKEHLKRE